MNHTQRVSSSIFPQWHQYVSGRSSRRLSTASARNIKPQQANCEQAAKRQRFQCSISRARGSVGAGESPGDDTVLLRLWLRYPRCRRKPVYGASLAALS